MTLLSVQNALARITAQIAPLESVRVPLSESVERVLAEDINAQFDLPLFDNSSMDGFAVIAADVTQACQAAPVTLQVIDDIPAGSASDKTLQRGQAARIMTGAPLPAGANAVVPVEETNHNERTSGAPLPPAINILKAAARGANIRKRGSDIHRGESVLRAGQRLRPQDLGMLAMLGIARVPVIRRPRIALLSSGDEIIPVGQPLSAGQIYDVNSYTLAALLKNSGCEIVPLGVAADTRESIRDALQRAAGEKVNLIVSSAGVSMGAFDFIKDVIETDGKLDFWRINMRPGKPLAFGDYHNIPLIGLAGNPVSAFIGFMVFVRPVIEKMLGRDGQAQGRVRVRLAEPVRSDGRESYLRAVVERHSTGLQARLTGHQGSGNLFSMVQANALLIIPAGVESLPVGAETEAWLIN